MILWDIYKAKKLGINTESAFATVLGREIKVPSEWVIEKFPYAYRQAANGAEIGSKCIDKIVGGSIAWNQLVKPISGTFESNDITYTANGSGEVSFSGIASDVSRLSTNNGVINVVKDHIYLISGISGGSSSTYALRLNMFGKTFYSDGLYKAAATTGTNLEIYIYKNANVNASVKSNMIDLTYMLGESVANYIYSLEQNKAGSGVTLVRKLFPKEYYEYDLGSLQSVNTSAHIMRDANDDVIGNYELDESLVLRGIPKVSNGNLYYDGDTYESNGTVTTKYGIREYQEGDETDGSTMVTDGTNTVYKLTTSTTATADSYVNPQKVVNGGTEEYVDYAVLQGNRDVSVPVGHETEYKMLYTE